MTTNRTTVHIDTSLQVEQQKIEACAQPVRVALSQFIFKSTSTFAKKEFKRAWLQDLGWLYKTIPECNDIGDLYAKIQKSFWPPFAKRRQQRCVEALQRCFQLVPPHTPLSLVLTKLRAHIGEAILTGYMWWERSVTYEFDGTQCVRARRPPSRAENGAIDVVVSKCKPTNIQCRVHEFFNQHRESFLKIRSEIDRKPEVSLELRSTAAAIDNAIHDPKYLCDDANCRKMSDALIAVDGIEMEVFAANNPREWGLIADALDKPLINPVVRQ